MRRGRAQGRGDVLPDRPGRCAIWRLAAATGLALGWATAALGSPTGLNVIPTAGILPKGAVSVQIQQGGEGPLLQHTREGFLLSQTGISSRLEAGVDRATRGGSGHDLLNAKYLLLSEGGGRLGVAIGVQNVSAHQIAQPYVVATRLLGRAGVHLGGIVLEGRSELMAGVDYLLGEGLALQADHTSGPLGATTVGIALQVHRRAVLTYAILFPAVGQPHGHLLNLAVLMGPEG